MRTYHWCVPPPPLSAHIFNLNTICGRFCINLFTSYCKITVKNKSIKLARVPCLSTSVSLLTQSQRSSPLVAPTVLGRTLSQPRGCEFPKHVWLPLVLCCWGRSLCFFQYRLHPNPIVPTKSFFKLTNNELWVSRWARQAECLGWSFLFFFSSILLLLTSEKKEG